MSLFSTLQERGFVYQSTDLESIKNILDGEKKITFYLGVDPTAESLHIGHFYALMMFRHLQRAGHTGILLFGGATASIGDPSGKSDMRKILSPKQIKDNITGLVKLAKNFINIDGENPTIIENNANWFSGYEYIDFMRDIGMHFNVNRMLASEAYAGRIKNGGLTFLEMGYMLMQAYDFVVLNKKYNCTLQIGGSDQWGNMVAGCSLRRKMLYGEDSENIKNKDDIFVLTCPLLTTKNGTKMGKSEKGTVWIDKEKTTPYDFYQYFYNVDDYDVNKLLKLFTDIDVEYIDNITKKDILSAKKLMAYEITKLVHGDIEANKVVETAKGLFLSGDTSNAPTKILEQNMIGNINIVDLCALSGFIPSKSQARQLISGGGISMNDKKVLDIAQKITTDDIKDNFLILKKGKKNFLKIIFQ